MERKSSTQMVRFLTQCLPIAFTLNDVGQFRSPLGKTYENPKMFLLTRKIQFRQPKIPIQKHIFLV